MMTKERGSKLKENRRRINLMMRFEDLEVWKRAAPLSVELYKQLRYQKD